MILFAKSVHDIVYALEFSGDLTEKTIEKINWLLNGELIKKDQLDGFFVGPRKEMITPWSTNAVEITENMGIAGISRIEAFRKVDSADSAHDKMLQVVYKGLNQAVFTVEIEPEPIKEIENIEAYNEKEGLALNDEEIAYLQSVSERLGRKLTDSEVFGFSQVNSEHCRHKIFNGLFIIDGVEKDASLFKMIKKTTETNRNSVVSAYKDNVAFLSGPTVQQFAPKTQDKPDYFETIEFNSLISVKAETHNFPTTVEPFNGAATGAGGEIRDRIAGGKGSMPLAGTAVYMTPYSRLEKNRKWEEKTEERPWLYQTPMDILIKASNGASDFGNKFGQPLISGSVLTFEHFEATKKYGYDKVIMLAGGIGYGIEEDALKGEPEKGDKVVLLGGDNYRIGMGGAAVSSVDTGNFSSGIELNAIQRSNPEMQKRAYNAIRAMSESGETNPIVSIHDHGAGGHLNCLSELLEEVGGTIEIDKLPIGDPTLSDKEIIGNESQERMGLIMKEKDLKTLKDVAERERAPMYIVGEATGDMRFKVTNTQNGKSPIDLSLSDFFGSAPKTIMEDKTIPSNFEGLKYDLSKLDEYIDAVLQLEAVACKDWLTNKVDRSVTGKVAKQQTCGEIQLPLNNVGVMALDYEGKSGIATSIGHAPIPSLIDEKAGSRLAIAESLTNIVFAPLKDQIKSVSLSANWMWPCNNEGEDARIYQAVEAVSDFAIDLGINIPTGKDSLSMVQKYKDGEKVFAPGTVIISAGGEVSDIKKVVSPNIEPIVGSELLYIDLSSDELKLGGSSFAQTLNQIGADTPDVKDAEGFKKSFNAVQELIEKGFILAGHDISSGGLITCLLEMCFPSPSVGLFVDTQSMGEKDLIKVLFSENPGLILQVEDAAEIQVQLEKKGIGSAVIGNVVNDRSFTLYHNAKSRTLDIDTLRDTWFKTSYLLDRKQSTPDLAKERFNNYKKQPIGIQLPSHFNGKLSSYSLLAHRKDTSGVKAAIIREKGVNGDREMAYAMYLAGFDVKDVHMTDLISGRETLDDINFIVFVGGFSNSDVLGSAKGWAGAFLYNEKAKATLDRFYNREDTMSLGVCNGCQLMVELGLIYPEKDRRPKMKHNQSGKFESTYLTVDVEDTNSIMLKSLKGSRLGIWVAHGEGQFSFPKSKDQYNLAMTYSYSSYPGNPNGSTFDSAGIVSDNGRHLAMMPHLERSIFPWQCASYPKSDTPHECTPWLEAFVNAKNWIEKEK